MLLGVTTGAKADTVQFRTEFILHAQLNDRLAACDRQPSAGQPRLLPPHPCNRDNKQRQQQLCALCVRLLNRDDNDETCAFLFSFVTPNDDVCDRLKPVRFGW